MTLEISSRALAQPSAGIGSAGKESYPGFFGIAVRKNVFLTPGKMLENQGNGANGYDGRCSHY